MIEIIKFYPLEKGHLRGFITIKIPKWGNFIIDNIAYFEKGDSRWINLPSQIYEDNGEKKYKPINRFEDSNISKSFNDQILTLIKDYLKNEVKKEEQLEIPF